MARDDAVLPVGGCSAVEERNGRGSRLRRHHGVQEPSLLRHLLWPSRKSFTLFVIVIVTHTITLNCKLSFVYHRNISLVNVKLLFLGWEPNGSCSRRCWRRWSPQPRNTKVRQTTIWNDVLVTVFLKKNKIFHPIVTSLVSPFSPSFHYSVSPTSCGPSPSTSARTPCPISTRTHTSCPGTMMNPVVPLLAFLLQPLLVLVRRPGRSHLADTERKLNPGFRMIVVK